MSLILGVIGAVIVLSVTLVTTMLMYAHGERNAQYETDNESTIGEP